MFQGSGRVDLAWHGAGKRERVFALFMVVFGIGCKCESGQDLHVRIRMKFDFLVEGLKS